ncbi:MAG: hypothetical protein ACE5OZ_05095 [Candidatus Heimdallarchaeota archaeon]
MPIRSLKVKLIRQGFIIGFPALIAISLYFGALVMLSDEEGRERTKEATGIDFNESASQMIILLGISFAILFVAFLWIVPGLIRKRR